MAKLPGELLQDLLDIWRKKYPRRAGGGFWALAGFSFQAAIYLLRFFKQLQSGIIEPGQLAEMEQLSDILCPEDGRFVLIQVKRTLRKHSIIKAVEEAYLITDLCRHEKHELVDKLKFKIVCQKRITNDNVVDLSMSDVITTGGNPESWQAMLRNFDPKQSITESPDPLEQLHVYLWNAGIKDTVALLQRCLGCLLSKFDMRDIEEIHNLGRDLASIFWQAERRSECVAVGHLLTTDDIETDPFAKTKDVLAGEIVPKLEHLRRGFFRDRPEVFQNLMTHFIQWIENHMETKETQAGLIPVFWISGRSGDGKTVLLLQLVAQLIRSDYFGYPLLQLQSGEGLIDFLRVIPESDSLSDSVRSRVFAVVDDLYDLSNPDTWDEKVRATVSLRSLPVAIITCGPTELREQFEHRLGDIFSIKYYDVSHVNREECLEFVEWFQQRTGQNRNIRNLTIKNTLMVQLMFELKKGIRLKAFANRFRRRLEHLGLFETVRIALAVNALYMDAFLDLPPGEHQDALARLSQEDQLHFQIRPRRLGSSIHHVRLIHSHLAWLLYVEWVTPPTTLAKTWARDLATDLYIMEQQNLWFSHQKLMYRLITTSHLSDDVEIGMVPRQAIRKELIEELYRIHVSKHGGCCSEGALSNWLEFQYKIPHLQLIPDPTEYAVLQISNYINDIRGQSNYPSVARWLWLISESRPPSQKKKLRNISESLFFTFEATRVTKEIKRLIHLAQDSQAAKQFVIKWLEHNSTNPATQGLINKMLLTFPHNPKLFKQACVWIEANLDRPNAYCLLSAMVKARPQDSTVYKQATTWTEANYDHPNVFELLSVMVKARPQDSTVYKQATTWIEANYDRPNAYWLLSAMVKARSQDSTVYKQATTWTEANYDHPNVYELLRVVVKARPQDSTVYKQATTWTEANLDHPNVYELLRTMVRIWPQDSTVYKQATTWTEANLDQPNAYELLNSMVRTWPQDSTVYKQATNWIEANYNRPNAYCLMSTIVKARPQDSTVYKEATNWTEANLDHPNVYELLRTMVRTWPQDSTVYKQATTWTEANLDHPNVYELLSAMVINWPQDSTVYKQANVWTDTNYNHPNVYELLRTMVRTWTQDSTVYKQATTWTEANLDHPNVYELLSAMVRTWPQDSTVYKQANAWTEANYDHPNVYELLSAMVRTWPQDSTVYKQATTLTEANYDHPKAPRLLSAMVKARAFNDAVVRQVDKWLTNNEYHPEYSQLLSSIIIATNGADEWLSRGTSYVTGHNPNHPEQIISVLLTAGKVQPKFIELALDYYFSSAAKRYKKFVFAHLVRAVIDNLSNVVKYLKEKHEEKRKRIVCVAIAYGFVKFSVTLQDNHVEIFKQLTSDKMGLILTYLVQYNVDSERLDILIAKWLVHNYRQKGYENILENLSKNTVQWDRIQKLGIITYAIIDDFDNLIN